MLAYPHIHDGRVAIGHMDVRHCPAKLDLFWPMDQDDHRAVIVPRNQAHNHPVYPERKLSQKAKQKYEEAVSVFGAMSATVGQVDKGWIF